MGRRRRIPGPVARALVVALAALCLARCGGDEHLTVDPARVDFGRMLHGDVVERELTLVNRSAGDVSITRTTFNCACFEVRPFGRLLHPGESRTVTVRFRSGDLPPGPIRGKHLDLLTTEPERPRLQVPLVGEIVRSLTVLPATVDLGTLGEAKSLETRTVRIRPGPGMTVELLRVRAQPAEIRADPKEVDGGFDLSVRWRPPAGPGRGRFLGTLEILARVSGEGFEPRELERVVRIQGEWPSDR